MVIVCRVLDLPGTRVTGPFAVDSEAWFVRLLNLEPDVSWQHQLMKFLQASS
jgi:hypothetical protein